MGFYWFQCEACAKRRLLPSKEAGPCADCGGKMARAPKTPSSHVVEALDNGAMSRRLERLSNAEELYRDRAKQDPQKNKPLKLT